MRIWKERLYRKRLQMHWWVLDRENDFSWIINRKKYLHQEQYREIIDTHKWVFIVGCNNSGTSILQRILEKSGQVSTFNLEGQRYSQVLPRAYKKGFERVYMEYADELEMKGNVEQYSPRLIHDWMRHLPQDCKKIVLEKTPANAIRMEWLQECFPNSCFIGLIRNGYAVSEGIRRKANKDIERAAKHWQNANRVLLNNSQKVDRYIQVQYEDIIDRPELVANSICDFVGINKSNLLEAMKDNFNLATVRGNEPMGLRNLNLDSFRHLNNDDIEKIYINAWQMLEHFKYDLER